LPSFALGGHTHEWEAYKKKFISEDGRIIDYFQNSMSHSEGQGYGLLLSLMNEDRKTFDRVAKWTVNNLQVRRDALFAWAWGKRYNETWSIIDYNNATDGDILIAFALVSAGKKWNHEPFTRLARRIIKDIRTQLAFKESNMMLLMPGYYGFTEPSGLVLNTGYLVFPAFTRFSVVDHAKFWNRIYSDGLKILKKARFSRFNLPSDWIRIQNGTVSVFTAKSPYFGYEAIRLPLYMIWDDNREQLEGFSKYLQFVQKSNYLPNRLNLVDGSISVDMAPAGFYAVFGRCAKSLGNLELGQKLIKVADDKISHESNDYFSHTLYLLSKGKLE
jgi:endoglucanase